jgi:hypothetical protein
MTIRRVGQMLCLLLLGALLLLVGSGALTSLLRAGTASLRAAQPAAPAAKAEPYTFPSVIHTPEETARARLLCADMGEQGWTIARRRERTGMTLDEALALLAKEHGGTPAFPPLEHVTYLAYADPAGTPEWARGFVQRVCLKEMLGSLVEPQAAPPAQATTPAQPRRTAKEAPRR